MSSMQTYLDKYGESHRNHTNKLIHWVCVPAIVFSLIGLLYAIPFISERTMLMNWGAVFLFLALLFYLKHSFPMFLGCATITLLMLWGNNAIFQAVEQSASKLAYISIAIFVVAWIGQFIGHKIEGAKPSFLDDLKFLLIGPAWLLHFIYKKIGIRY